MRCAILKAVDFLVKYLSVFEFDFIEFFVVLLISLYDLLCAGSSEMSSAIVRGCGNLSEK